MLEREREREVSTTLAGGIEEESMVGGGNFIVWGHHQSLNMEGDFRLDMALGFHIGDSDFCYSEGYVNVSHLNIYSTSANNYVPCVRYFLKLNGLVLVKYYVNIPLAT